MATTFLIAAAVLLYWIVLLLVPVPGGQKALHAVVGGGIIAGMGALLATLHAQTLRRRSQGTDEAFNQMAEGDLRLSQADMPERIEPGGAYLSLRRCGSSRTILSVPVAPMPL